MRTTNPIGSSQKHKIILLRGNTLEVLLGFDGTHRAFPTLKVPLGERVAECLTGQLRATYGISAVSLGSLASRLPEVSSGEMAYELMEACAPGDEAPLGKYWVSVRELTETAFRDPADFTALQQVIAQSAGDLERTPHAPFGRLGWFPAVETWIEQQIAFLGLHGSGRFRQLNASPSFNLIRFETDGPALWFKAVGPPNEREYPITQTLARLFPRFLPPIVATRPEWNAWLTLEAEGPLLLDESCGLAAWKAAARDLAELQIHSVGRSLRLRELGARDLRTHELVPRVEPFFQVIGELMERQTKTSPAPLTHNELACLSAIVRDALNILDETNFPSCLGHRDLNPGNIIAPLTGCVFLDWAEAFVGHPFLTFEYLREHFRRTFGSETTEDNDFASCYSFAWREFVTESDLHKAAEVAPLLAVFAYAAGSELWSHPQNHEAHTAGFLRSLARRMHREARALRERSVSCPS